MHEMQKAACFVPPSLSADGQERWLCTFPIFDSGPQELATSLAAPRAASSFLMWEAKLESWQSSGAWNRNHDGAAEAFGGKAPARARRGELGRGWRAPKENKLVGI